MKPDAGTIMRAQYVECASWHDNRSCTAEATFPVHSISGAKYKLGLLGWVQDKERGWLCPKCVGALMRQRTRAANKAKALKKKGAPGDQRKTP